MTALPASLPLTVSHARTLAPTRAERLLLRASRALEAATLRRIEGRAASSTTTASDAVEDRRTAQALGAVGILPR